jgi:O-antigen/teichoic acid export membrane protein
MVSITEQQKENVPQRSAARGTAQLLVGRVCFFVFGYLTSVLIARNLGPAAYGIYGIVMSVLIWIEQMCKTGIIAAIVKMIPGSERQIVPIKQSGAILQIVLSLILFACLWFGSPYLSSLLHIQEGTRLIRLAAIDIPFIAMYFFYQAVLEGHRRFGEVSVAGIVYSASKMIGILILTFIGLSISSALVVNILASVCALLFVYVVSQASLKVKEVNKRVSSQILRLALPMWPYALGFSVLFVLDLWCLQIFLSDKEELVGLYVAANNIAKLPSVVLFFVAGIILPLISMAYSKRDVALIQRYVQGIMRFLLLIILPVSVLFAITSEELVIFIFSNRYTGGGVFLSVLVFAFGMFVFLDTFVNILYAVNRIYISTGIVLALVPCVLILNSIFIPTFGAIGAATSSIIAAFIGACILGFIVYNQIGQLIVPSTVIKVVLASFAST